MHDVQVQAEPRNTCPAPGRQFPRKLPQPEQPRERVVEAHKPAVRGAVYGVILNDRDSLERMPGPALADASPAGQASKAPVLYIKPAGTVVGSGAVVRLPAGESAVEVGATLAVFGQARLRLAPEAVPPPSPAAWWWPT